MTREETVRFIYDILKKHSVKVNEVDVIPVSSCIALVDDLIEHEADLLKEFVEWYKKRLEHIQEHEKEFLDDDAKHEYLYLVEYRKGTTDMLDRLLLHIDKHLEKFLEERK